MTMPSREHVFLPAILAGVLLLAACGRTSEVRKADVAFEAGQYASAVASYREAAQAEPRNVRYQQRYLTRRDEALHRLFADASAALRQSRFADAEAALAEAEAISPGDLLVRQRRSELALARARSERLVEADELLSSGKPEQAAELAGKLLQEAPDSERAANTLARARAALQAEHEATSDGLDARFRKPVTLELRDVPVRVAFEVLSKASGINFVYDQEVRPDLKVAVFLRKTPLDEAIRLIGVSTQLQTRVLNANTILVYPNTPQKNGDYRELTIRAFYLRNASAKDVEATLKAVVKTENIVVDEKLNMLVLRDTPEAVRIAERLVALQDVDRPELVLEVQVLEMKHSSLVDLGVALPSSIGVSVNSGTGGAGSTALSIDDLRALNSSTIYASVPNATIKMQDERSNAHILANPRLRVTSREKASILIGDKVPVITSTSTSTGFVAETVSYVDVGLKLEVEPTVFIGDESSIKVDLEVSNLVREIESRSGTISYQIGTRSAQTTLRLRDGETQVLAGLIDREDRRVASGIPGLSRFPVLNRLFGASKRDLQDTEIVLSITPHLVRSIPSATPDALSIPSGTANNLGQVIASAAPAPDAESDPASDAGTASDAGAGSAGPAPAATVPSATAPAEAAARAVAARFAWLMPQQVRAGEQFTAVLNITAQVPESELALLLGYDPRRLQVVSVQPGDFLRQGGTDAALTQSGDPAQGKLSVALVRDQSAVSGQGALLQVNFKALEAGSPTSISVLSATAAPNSIDGIPLPTAVLEIK